VRKALIELIRTSRNYDEAEAVTAFELVKGRYATDIFE
jgi:hypothetical protein